MINKKIFFCICTLLILFSSSGYAQTRVASDTTAIKVSADSVRVAQKEARKWIRGVELGTDLCGGLMAAFSSWGQIEAIGKLNLRNMIFPVVEIGYGISHQKDRFTNIEYKNNSPYVRVGVDYNFLSKKEKDNRIFAGIRFAYSPYTFQVNSPNLHNPVYGDILPVHIKNAKGNQSWAELVVGIETQLWRFIYVGWTARYKLRFSQKKSSFGNADYVPGYGRNRQKGFGGSFNLNFKL